MELLLATDGDGRPGHKRLILHEFRASFSDRGRGVPRGTGFPRSQYIFRMLE